ncbi:MAG TPA: FAD-dependent oxidoreductase [Actinopolymorphaceae bacterium]
MTDRSRLDPQRRTRMLQALGAREFDVAVVGGGALGCGVAVDAASRGLSVALVEAEDFGAGSATGSGEIVLGGPPQLLRVELGSARRALLERDLMVDCLCPHLVRTEPFLVPVERPWDRLRTGVGTMAHDLFRLTGPPRGGGRCLFRWPGAKNKVPWNGHLGRRATLETAPALRPERIRGAVRYWDAVLDDARHTLLLARTAAGIGATVANRVEAVEVTRSAGRISGLRVRDLESGDQFEVSARVVVNATGLEAERLQSLAKGRAVAVGTARSVRAVLPGARFDATSGVVIPGPDGPVGIRRWHDNWLIGTTDIHRDHDVGQLLAQIAPWLRSPIERTHLTGIHARNRPVIGLIGRPEASEVVVEEPRGFVTVVSNSYALYRVLAREAVDLAVRRIGRSAPGSKTHRLPVLGASGYRVLRGMRSQLAEQFGLEEARVDHLLGRYGSLTTELLDLIDARPELGKPLAAAPRYAAAEIVYAVQAEGALHLGDVLARRTRIAMESPDGGLTAAPEVARLMADTLDWSPAQMARELADYQAGYEAEMRARD